MFVIELIYKAPLETIDAHMKAHGVFLDKYYKAGIFLTWGRKVPRNGGIIIASLINKEELENIMKEDPFSIHKLARIKITEFVERKKLG